MTGSGGGPVQAARSSAGSRPESVLPSGHPDNEIVAWVRWSHRGPAVHDRDQCLDPWFTRTGLRLRSGQRPFHFGFEAEISNAIKVKIIYIANLAIRINADREELWLCPCKVSGTIRLNKTCLYFRCNGRSRSRFFRNYEENHRLLTGEVLQRGLSGFQGRCNSRVTPFQKILSFPILFLIGEVPLYLCNDWI